jgi:predicted RNA binding protein YcfA (HicA-like mRNA interferase family)
MNPVSGKAFAKIVESHGWKLLRIKGSHHVYGKQGHKERLSIPIHGAAALKTGLQRHFMRIAALTDEDLD